MYGTVADAALIEAAQRIAPLVRACRDEGERERRLPAQVLAAMHEAWLFRMYIPKALDGLEIDPITSMIVVEEIARADAAAAWNLMLGAIYGRGAATPMSATIPTRRRAELAPPLAWIKPQLAKLVPGGICRRRMERSRGQPSSYRVVAARLPHTGRQADLRGPSRHRHAPGRVGAPVAAPPAVGDPKDGAGRATATRKPVRFTTGASGPLDTARKCGRGELC